MASWSMEGLILGVILCTCFLCFSKPFSMGYRLVSITVWYYYSSNWSPPFSQVGVVVQYSTVKVVRPSYQVIDSTAVELPSYQPKEPH